MKSTLTVEQHRKQMMFHWITFLVSKKGYHVYSRALDMRLDQYQAGTHPPDMEMEFQQWLTTRKWNTRANPVQE